MTVFSNEERVKILADIVGMKTVNDNEIEVCHYLKDLFAQHGIDAEIDKVSESRANLISTIGEGRPVVGISGHMDVVSEGNADEWTYDPFTLTEHEGYLYGRGAADMKSGLAALAIAMIEIKSAGDLKQGTIKFMATTGEEMEQLGSKQLYEQGHMDEVEALIIAEPSETMLVYAHKGSMDFRITSKGLSTHSSMPVLGKNAIQPLLTFIQRIDNAYEALFEDVEGKALDFSNFISHMRDKIPSTIDQSQLERLLSGPVISNTLIEGGNQVNSIPEYASADFNVRTVPEFDNEAMRRLFKKHLDEMNAENAQLEEDIYLDLEPVITTGDNALVKLGHKLAEEHFQKSIALAPSVAVTDASNLLRGKDENFSFLMLGPGEDMHQVDEKVNKETYLNFITYYIKLLTAYMDTTSE